MRSPYERMTLVASAEKKITEAQRTGAWSLNLSNLGLKRLPTSLGQLSQLQELIITNNQLTTLPDWFKHLTRLQHLDASHNQLQDLPESLYQLTQLRSLDVSHNRLKVLSETIDQLTQLKKLAISFNGLKVLPESLCRLAQLQQLYVSNNQLTGFPKSLGQLTQLQWLDASNNQLISLPGSFDQLTQLHRLDILKNRLTALPESLGQLTQLQWLDISDNQLTTLPDSLSQLTQLYRLNVFNNQLAALPNSLGQLTQLQELYLHGNDQLGLPEKILGSTLYEVLITKAKPTKPAEILEYYFRTRSGSRPLNEAKVILVGSGGAGKTSLVKQLVHGGPFDKNESKTDGIQITTWQVRVGNNDVNVNIWDFGGQEIMHATHQFFLTERSLYLLVLNGREGREDYDVEYWLKLIESFGGNSPVVVILNKIQQHPFDLNYEALKVKYPQIHCFIKTDCEFKLGITELREEITERLDKLPDIRAKFPASWFAIKNRLARMQENYLSLYQYRKVCSEFGELEEKAQDDLAGYLHCLGIALNYSHDPRLRNTSVLNPRWVTRGIYCLLNAKELVDRKGEVRLEDLQTLLPAQDYPPEQHEFLLELMRKFNLCFAYPDDPQNRYLVPELLGKDEPDYLRGEFDPGQCLNFEYHYKILPEGLLPNFIVRTHILSTNQPRWRSGVLLAWEGCRALVKADAADRKVTISLQGPSAEGRRRLLAVIRSDFERIHSDIPRLEVIPKIPVPGHPKVVLEYEELCIFEKDGETEFKKCINGKIVKLNVRDLLSSVDLVGTRLKEQQFECSSAPLKLFNSYSHKDEKLRNELETHLKLLQRFGEISTWHDRKILAGDEWQEKIDENLEVADITLLLVSPDFLASDYCYDIEMKRALKRHQNRTACVIPVILRECGWNSAPFGKLHALPKNGKAIKSWRDRDSAWNNVAEGIRVVVQKLRKQKTE